MSEKSFSEEVINAAFQWLEWQCKMVSDVRLGVVYMLNEQHEIELVSKWSIHDAPVPSRLKEVASEILAGNDTYLYKDQCSLNDKTYVCDVFSLPIKCKDKVVGSVSMMLSVRSEEQKSAVLHLLQWGIVWLETLLSNALNSNYAADTLINDIAQQVLKRQPNELMGYQVCNIIKKRFGCQRVAMGVFSGSEIKLLALSDQLKFEANSSMVRTLEGTMNECAEQNGVINLSSHPTDKVTFKHREYSEAFNHAQVMSMPLVSENHINGVLLLQRNSQNPFSHHETQVLEKAAVLIANALSLETYKRRSFGRNGALAQTGLVSKIFGKEHLWLKAGVLSLLMAIVLLSVIKTDDIVYAKSRVVGSLQHVIVAPQDGYIDEAFVRAGEELKAGSLMVLLDQNDLLIEQQRLNSELSKNQREYQQALAMNERSKVALVLAEKEQIKAKLDLLATQIQRSEIKAPIDGLVVSGDLSQMLGSPVKKGQQLFEVAPLKDYRVVLEIDEHDVARVAVGQKGALRLTGMPYDSLPIELNHITSLAEAKNGGNFFRIEASVESTQQNIKPGMQGVAQVKVGRASVLEVWLNSTVNRIRLWFWSWGW